MAALVAFDLDDTLYKEMTYVASGYRAVAAELARITGADADELFRIISANRPLGFEAALDFLGGNAPLTVDDMIEIYRAHTPAIELTEGAAEVLTELARRGHHLMLITDGSPRHQGAKIKALGLDRFFKSEDILISQVTGGDKFTSIPTDIADRRAHDLGLMRRYYVGDNPTKDFLWPNRRGWTSVMLRDDAAANVFAHTPAEVAADHRPDTVIPDLQTLLKIIN